MTGNKLHIYDDSATLWRDLAQTWANDLESVLVVANDKQRDNFLRMILKEKNDGVIVGNRVLTVQQLYGRLQAASKKTLPPTIPVPLLDIIIQHVYRQHELSFNARAQAATEIGLCVENDLPLTPSQQAVVDEVNRRGYRIYQQEPNLLLAQLPDTVSIASKVLFAPSGGLGMAVLKILPRVHGLERWSYNVPLQQILDGEEVIYHQQQAVVKTRQADMITQTDPDLMSTALKKARSLINDGVLPGDITIVCWDNISTVIPLAAKYDVPIEASLRPAILNNPLLGLLSAVVNDPHNPDYDGIDGVAAYRAADTPLDGLICAYEIGTALLANEDESYTDYNIVKAYLKTLANQIIIYAEHANEQEQGQGEGECYTFALPDAADVIDNTQGDELIYRSGDNGVIITSLAGVVNHKTKHLIIPGFSDTQLRYRISDSPFNLVEANKALRASADVNIERFLQNALAAADHVLIIHGSKNAEGFDEIISPLLRNAAPLVRVHPQKIYSGPLSIARQVEELQAVNYKVGTQFSVTELEAYLRCPLGWYVRYVLKPQGIKPSTAMERGNLLHGVLEDIYADHELIDTEGLVLAATTGLAKENVATEYPILTDTELAVYQQFLERVIRQYSGPYWPFVQTMVEEKVALRGALPNFSNITLTGKVDRIDYDDQGRPLIIDYKHNKSVNATPSKSDNDLQVGLYPHLLKETYSADDLDPLGFLYISIVKGQAIGVSTSISPLTENVNRRFAKEPLEATMERCVAAAEKAIRGIHNGDVFHVGAQCNVEWCPHHLLSHTLQAKEAGDEG